MAQSWGMLISSSVYFGASFWTLLKKIVFVLSFSLLFFIWLIAVSAFYCVNLAEWIQGVSDSTFMWADGKTRQFQITILAHLQFFDVHSLWVWCSWSPHLSCIIKYWWKAVIINGLKYWVNYMVGLPAVEWFALCHAGQLQKYSVIWPRCEEFPNKFVQILSIPVLSLCVVLCLITRKGMPPFQSPLHCVTAPHLDILPWFTAFLFYQFSQRP